MNWLAKAIVRLATLPVLLFFLFSCKDRDKIGLSPENPLPVLFTDTVTIDGSVLMTSEPIYTGGSRALEVGIVNDDPDFGSIYAEGYVQLTNRNGISDTAGAVVDSVELNLMAEHGLGNVSQAHSIVVYQLKPTAANLSPLNADSIYLSTHPALPIEKDSLGKLDLMGVPGSGILSIKFNPAFGNLFGKRLLNAAKNSNTDFKNITRGLAIIPRGEGVIWDINLGSTLAGSKDTSTYLQVHYHIGTVKYSYKVPLTGPANTEANTGRFYRMISNKSNSTLAPLQSGDSISLTGNKKGYIQAGVGVKTKLWFPYLAKFRERSNVIVNKAELILPVPSISAEAPTPPELNLLVPDNAGNYFETDGTPYFVLQENISSVPYNLAEKRYTFFLSTFVRDVVSGTGKNYPLLIAPEPSNSLRRVVFSNPKLRIYYTIVD